MLGEFKLEHYRGVLNIVFGETQAKMTKQKTAEGLHGYDLTF